MSDPNKPTFLVSAYTDPIAVRIQGKANYLNCGNFRDFIEAMEQGGHTRFAFDLEHCRGMDSTFLGILAGLALKLREQDPAGILLVCHLSERNRELICNLGLQNLLTIDSELCGQSNSSPEFTQLDNKEVADARKVLEAHENLLAADNSNADQFQDVIAFLRNQVDQE
ncbi:MAG: STAS domain-containing protein [Pseudomonadales bacterium]|nr:STAS domain-containing protein [Pseudomonadales bacterium]